jgi:hypothetical protein
MGLSKPIFTINLFTRMIMNVKVNPTATNIRVPYPFLTSKPNKLEIEDDQNKMKRPMKKYPRVVEARGRSIDFIHLLAYDCIATSIFRSWNCIVLLHTT